MGLKEANKQKIKENGSIFFSKKAKHDTIKGRKKGKRIVWRKYWLRRVMVYLLTPR